MRSKEEQSVFIEEDFGNRFIVRFSVAVACVFSLGAVVLYYSLDRDLTGGYGAAFLSLLDVRNALLRYILYSTIIQAAVLGVATGALATLTSHKIAGPVFRMKKYLTAFRRGERIPGGLRLRAHDQAQPFATAMEEAFERLRRGFGEAADQADELADRIEGGKTVCAAELDALRETLSAYRVK